MEWAISISDVIVTASIAGLGVYLKSYLVKKADFKATNENIDSLVSQLEKTTQATKSIEAQLNNTAWLNQQRWEIKKEFYLKSLVLITDSSNCFSKIEQLRLSSLESKDSKKSDEIDIEIDALLDKISDKYVELKYFVDITGVLFLSPESLDAINTYLDAEKNRTNRIYLRVVDSNDNQSLSEAHAEAHSFDLYFYNQVENCEIARDMLIREAQSDLSIAWDQN